MRRNSRNRKRNSKTFSNLISHIDTKKFILFMIILFLIFLILFVCFKLGSINRSNSAFNYEISNLYIENISNSTQVSTSNEVNSNSASDDSKEFNDSTTFTIAAIGDVMCHNTQYLDAYNKSTGEYDFSYVFSDIIDYTKIPNLTIGNLETTFAGEAVGYSNYPTFNSPDNIATSLRSIGVDVLSTAGNHALDKGFSGLSRTIDVLNENLIYTTGTNKTQEDQDTILYQYVKGVKIAILSYTYGTNGISIPSDKPYCVNLIDKDLIKSHIEKAKSEDADLIICCMHWGVEYQETPNSEQRELADFLFQNGVDIVLGNHPHTLQPMEKRTVTLEDGSTKDGFIIYALGNFMADQSDVDTRSSIILKLTITKHEDNHISIDDASYTPIYMYKNTSASTHKFKILDMQKTISNYEKGIDTSIGKSMYNTLKSQLTRINDILGT